MHERDWHVVTEPPDGHHLRIALVVFTRRHRRFRRIATASGLDYPLNIPPAAKQMVS